MATATKAPAKAPAKGAAKAPVKSASSSKAVQAVAAATGRVSSSAGAVPRLKQKYREEIAPALHQQFAYGNVMQIPGLDKIVVNMGVGDAARDSKVIDSAVRDLTLITGQKPSVTKARKSIAQFKLREGMPIGCHVTLRGDRMWEFADRLLTLALPRIRDFRGLSARQFDGNGNYTFGLTEQVMFHEIDQDRIDRLRGMDITFVTSATTDDEGRALMKGLGFPFKAPENDPKKVTRKKKKPVGGSKSAQKKSLKPAPKKKK